MILPCLLALTIQAPALDPVAPAGAGAADVLDAAVKPLIEALKDPDADVRSAAALCNLDKRAVPALVKLLEGNDKQHQVQAARVISSMAAHGRRHTEALPALLHMLKDEDVEVRRAAASAISGVSVKALEKDGRK